MKTIKTLIICLATISTLSAQDSLAIKQRRHEIGIDFTYFIKNYLNFGEYYNPDVLSTPFYLQYRFHFKSNNNIRAAIGGGFYETIVPSPYDTDHNVYKTKHQSLNFRIGFEHFVNLSRKFQMFYGLDLISTNSYQRNDAPYFNGGYANGNETSNKGYGVAPLLGIRYKINKRLSVFTETSFQVNMTKSWQQRYYTSVAPIYPQLESHRTDTKSINTAFNIPLFIVLAFDI